MRFRLSGSEGLLDRSSRPHRSPRRLSESIFVSKRACVHDPWWDYWRRLAEPSSSIAPVLPVQQAWLSRCLLYWRRTWPYCCFRKAPAPTAPRWDASTLRFSIGNGRQCTRHSGSHPLFRDITGRERPLLLRRRPLSPTYYANAGTARHHRNHNLCAHAPHLS